MQVYHSLLHQVLKKGNDRLDRTGIGTRSLFGAQIHFDLSIGFPILGTKKIHFRSIVAELLWFLKGKTNVKYLHEHGITIWDEWADEQGELGPIYGHQWRHWDGKEGPIDQISRVIKQICDIPHSRRHVVSAWNVDQISYMALPPCHCLFQFYVSNGRLSTKLYQRSADLFIGVPFNIASYALLTHIIAVATKLQVGEFIHSFGDVHLYHNHFEQARILLQRKSNALPQLKILHIERAPFAFEVEDFQLHNYYPASAIPAAVAV